MCSAIPQTGHAEEQPEDARDEREGLYGKISLMESNHERASSTSPPFFSSASKSRAMSSLATPR